MVRRELWTPAQGVNDDAMFLPIVGAVNSAFFLEFGWLLFVAEVTPILGFVAGMLYSRWRESAKNLSVLPR
jgi:hypothetical protein